MIKDSGERTEFSTGAVRDMKDGKGRFDLLPWYGIMEVSKHCEEGAKKYGEHNVDRGIPLHSLMDSASRHLAKFIAGERDEDHLRAAAWNILWALNQRTTHPELNDMYWAKKDIPSTEEEDDPYTINLEGTKIRLENEIKASDITEEIVREMISKCEKVDIIRLNFETPGKCPEYLGSYMLGFVDDEIAAIRTNESCKYLIIGYLMLCGKHIRIYKHTESKKN